MRSLILVVMMALAGCSSTVSNPPQTVGEVDLERYQGLWYEQARLPLFFQRDCVASQAQYQLQPDGSLSVLNSCVTAEGEWQKAEGKATVQEGAKDRFWVEFDNWFSRLLPGVTRGHYWVLYLDDDYQHVLVGNPERKYLWLLSRSEQLDPVMRERLLQEASARGYDTSGLIWRQ